MILKYHQFNESKYVGQIGRTPGAHWVSNKFTKEDLQEKSSYKSYRPE